MATKEYAICLPADDVQYAVEEMGKFMGIPIDVQAIEDAFDAGDEIIDADAPEDIFTPECVAIFYDPSNHNNVIVADLGYGDWLQMVHVRCEKENAKAVHDKLLFVDTVIRESAGEHTNKFLDERTGNSKCGILSVEKKYGIKI